MNFLNNRIVQILLAVCVIVAICILVGINLTIHAGSSGVGASIERINK